MDQIVQTVSSNIPLLFDVIVVFILFHSIADLMLSIFYGKLFLSKLTHPRGARAIGDPDQYADKKARVLSALILFILIICLAAVLGAINKEITTDTFYINVVVAVIGFVFGILQYEKTMKKRAYQDSQKVNTRIKE